MAADWITLIVMIISVNPTIGSYINEGYPDYHTVHPSIKCVDDDCNHIQLHFDVENETFSYDMGRNQLIVDGVQDGQSSSGQASLGCYYQNMTNSEYAALRICNGLVDGILEKTGSLYEIHYDTESGEHKFYHIKNGASQSSCNLQNPNNETLKQEALAANVSRQTVGRPSTSYLEVQLVYDFEMSLFFNHDEAKIIQHSYSLLNAVDAAYQNMAVGLRVIPKGLPIIWKHGDPIGIGLTPEHHLDNFKDYAFQHYYNGGQGFDVIQLITGLVVDKSNNGTYAMGLASRGFNILCTEDAVSYIAYVDRHGRPITFRALALTSAHEIGHNFGLIHVNGYSFNCKYCFYKKNGVIYGSRCIMDEDGRDVHPFWSVCSKKYMIDLLDDHSRASCLANAPSQDPPFNTFPTNKPTTGMAIFWNTTIKTETVDNVRYIRINSPSTDNAWNVEAFDRLAEQFQSANQDDGVKLVVHSGTGDFFTSGNDQTNFNMFIGKTVTEAEKGVNLLVSCIKGLISSVINLRKPLIVAANGPGVGGGLNILGLTDLALCSDRTYFWAPFSRLGLSPAFCATFTIPALIGRVRANELFMANRKVTAEEALSWGLVSHVYPHEQFESCLRDYVHGDKGILKTGSADAIIATKSLMVNQDRLNILNQVNQQEMKVLRQRLFSKEAIGFAVKFMNK
ncbi:Enoyl-CoA delta isomerase 2 [Halotydeus destructor]|nr:Enoyl-CoA delta isomerase 2 [Halotydeus destructor]